MKNFFVLLCLFCLPLLADAPKIYLDNDNHFALEGYDAVTYFEGGQPEIGVKPNQAEWQGVYWRFSKAENLKKFEKNPNKYAPQYGGYCATAVAKGRLTGGLPNLWEVNDGKLYLFCSHEALQQWKENRKELKKSADNNWPKILKKNN